MQNPAIPFGAGIAVPFAKEAAHAATHMVPGLAFAASTVKAVANVPRSIAVLSGLERMAAASKNKVADLASTIVRGGAKASKIARAEIEAGVASHFGKEDNEQDFERKTKLIRDLASSPQYSMRTLEGMTQGVHEHAPNTSAALQATAARAVSYLFGKIPTHPPTALGGQWKVSQAEKAEWLRAYDGASKPLSVLKSVASGNHTQEGLNAFQFVHPQLYDAARAALTNAAANHRDSIDYRGRAGIAAVMGQDVDGTTTPDFIRALQIAHAGPQRPNQPQGSARAEKITLGQRSLTSTQSNSQRSR